MSSLILILVHMPVSVSAHVCQWRVGTKVDSEHSRSIGLHQFVVKTGTRLVSAQGSNSTREGVGRGRPDLSPPSHLGAKAKTDASSFSPSCASTRASSLTWTSTTSRRESHQNGETMRIEGNDDKSELEDSALRPPAPPLSHLPLVVLPPQPRPHSLGKGRRFLSSGAETDGLGRRWTRTRQDASLLRRPRPRCHHPRLHRVLFV